MKTHVSNILSKLHLADRTQAAIYGLHERLVPLGQALENQNSAPPSYCCCGSVPFEAAVAADRG